MKANAMSNCRMLLGITILLLFIIFAGSASAEGKFQTDPATGCKMWNPNPEPTDTFTWSGGCNNGYGDGFGTAQYFSSGKFVGKYEGTLIAGKRSGKGTASWINGDRYEGDWLNDNLHGKGVMTSTDGTRYEGGWNNDKMHGYGIYVWPDGRRYEGNWLDGNMHGYGTMNYPDGRVQRGSFENGNYVGP